MGQTWQNLIAECHSAVKEQHGFAYCSEWDSEENFARHIVEECYNLEKMMDNLANYVALFS